MPEPSIDLERRIVSVLFADLVGFTSLSERLDPEDVATIQDAYFATVRESVARHGGVLEKFIGDAAMAVFGVPRARDDDAERAVRAGLALIGAVELLSARLDLDADVPGLRLRVGVNSGEVVSAESGPDAGRVTGDTVNLAARFQTAADPGTVLVGELTQLSAADGVEFIPVGELALKGKVDPVAAWRVAGVRRERSREEALGALRAPLLGREAEMEALTAALAGAPGSARALVLVAPPGVGKSRLLLEFATRAETTGAGVLRTRVLADTLGPVEPISQLLMAALRPHGGASRQAAPAILDESLRAAGATTGRAAVVCQETLDTLWPPSAQPTAPPDRDARFGAWLEALDALGEDHVNAWLVEDIHWAGPDLLAFLDRAGREPSRGGRLVVATARPSVLEHLPEGTETVDLPPLPAVNAAEMVHALVGGVLPEAVVTDIADRSDGNPLFIEELLRSWISSGTLVAADAGWELAVSPEAVRLPATVQAIYAAQLDDLPAQARLLARRASVAGRRFAARALEPLEVPEPEAGLDALRQRAFLRGPELDHAGEEVYAYRHALLRDAGYASLSRAERERLHRALAAWLEQTAGSDVARVAEPIASHYESALAALPAVGGDPADRHRLTDAARTWLEWAADAALGAAAHEAAVALLARAAKLAASGSREEARLRMRRGEVLAVTGDLDAGMAELRAALDAFATAFDADRSDADARAGYGNAAASLGEAMIEQIRFIEARDLVAAALAEIGPPRDALVGRLLAVHAWAQVAQGDREGTLDEIEQATALTRGGDPRLEVEVLGWRANVQSEAGVPADWGAVEAAARATGMWKVAIGAILMRAGNDPDLSARDVLAALEGGLELAISHGLTEPAARARYAIIETRLQIGDWDVAIDEAHENLVVAERYGYLRPALRTWMAVAPILAARGDRAGLSPFADWYTANASALPQPLSAYGKVHFATMDRLLADVGLPPVYGTPFDVRATPLEAYSNPDFVAATEVLVQGWIREGSLVDAREALTNATVSWLDSPGSPPTALMRGSLQLMATWLARANGEPADAIAVAARNAVGLTHAADAPWWAARAIRAIPAEEATAEELAEAEEIERRLRVVAGASAPPV